MVRWKQIKVPGNDGGKGAHVVRLAKQAQEGSITTTMQRNELQKREHPWIRRCLEFPLGMGWDAWLLCVVITEIHTLHDLENGKHAMTSIITSLSWYCVVHHSLDEVTLQRKWNHACARA